MNVSRHKTLTMFSFSGVLHLVFLIKMVLFLEKCDDLW